MTIRMNAASRRLLAGSALGGLIAFAAVPPGDGAMAAAVESYRPLGSHRAAA